MKKVWKKWEKGEYTHIFLLLISFYYSGIIIISLTFIFWHYRSSYLTFPVLLFILFYFLALLFILFDFFLVLFILSYFLALLLSYFILWYYFILFFLVSFILFFWSLVSCSVPCLLPSLLSLFAHSFVCLFTSQCSPSSFFPSVCLCMFLIIYSPPDTFMFTPLSMHLLVLLLISIYLGIYYFFWYLLTHLFVHLPVFLLVYLISLSVYSYNNNCLITDLSHIIPSFIFSPFIYFYYVLFLTFTFPNDPTRLITLHLP